ncbi:hypothetical protein C3941_08830 [Kaistia algarum]|uniref:helix-turn-helix domain-containing protein n=1 Tax=Kaistia algarum TaxID=2083279 RepID=UPI000CE85C45|nr:helix-turn-helix domain-containing protein [Kaistia algarum]MCX5512162.1 hypothetical protein [Kaistia algarum]PPE80263.1 hypothetical protein C3941_08830 [Kaistia algarum]
MFAELDGWSRGSGSGGKGNGREGLGRLLAETVGDALRVDPDRLSRKGRGDARTAFARHVAIYLACTRFGLSFTEAGRLFGRDRTTAAYACRRIEEERDEASTDRFVDQLDRSIGWQLLRPADREVAA